MKYSRQTQLIPVILCSVKVSCSSNILNDGVYT